MKRAVFFAVCLGLALAVVVSAQAPSSGAAPRKKRVAVFDFDYATVHAYSRAIFGSEWASENETIALFSSSCIRQFISGSLESPVSMA